MKNYLTSNVESMNEKGDNKASNFFSRQVKHACGSHPDVAEHEEIAKKLNKNIETLKRW